MQTARLFAIAFGCLAAAGCTTGPDYRRPPVDTPPAFREMPAAAAASASASAAVAAPVTDSTRLAQADAALATLPGVALGTADLLDRAWWSAFGDPQLDALIQVALEENKDLRIAAYRIEQFDAFVQVTRSAGLPQVGYRGERTRDTLSENRQVPLAAGVDPVSNNYQIGLAASWELDLWGRLRRANEAAYAELVSSEENRRALQQSLVSDVAATYIRLLAVDRELELMQQAVANNRETLRLAERAFQNGGNSELPVLHALAELHQRQSELPAKEAERAVVENALSALLGRNPGPIARGKAVAELAMPLVPAGLPANLLAQRPDIRRAEQDLVAANARIGVAKAQYLPSISLTGSSGFASTDLSTLTALTSNFGSFGVALLGPIFTAGRIEGQVREAEALQNQAAVSYARAVQVALREVDDALGTNARLGQQSGIRALQVAALREQRDLARRRYENGYTSFFPVVEAEQALTAGQLLQNETRREQFKALIAIYKAMGGGWALPEVTASRPPSPKTVHD